MRPENDLIRGHCGISVARRRLRTAKQAPSGIRRRSTLNETQAVSLTLPGHTPRRGALAPDETNQKE